MKIDLSIIVVSYNTQKLLKQCLKSLKLKAKSLKLKMKNEKCQMLNLEVIVVDNNSTDGSKKMINDQWPMVKLIANNKNLGFAKASNQGIKIARGKYILLLNSDTIVKRRALLELVNFAEKEKRAGGAAPRLLNTDGSIQASCFRFPSLRGAIKEFWLGNKGSFSKYFPNTSKPTVVDAAVGATLLLPQKTIKKIGLLDERYFMYFEDFDYCLRMKKEGLKLYYLPEVSIIHLHGASSKKIKSKPNQWLVESSKIYHGLFKHYLINAIIWSGQKWQKVKNKFCPGGRITK